MSAPTLFGEHCSAAAAPTPARRVTAAALGPEWAAEETAPLPKQALVVLPRAALPGTRAMVWRMAYQRRARMAHQPQF